MEKKKLLFVMNHLHCGGAEKALVSLLQTIDYSRFEVDLLLFKREGMFFDQIPGQVNILEEPKAYNYFDMPLKNALTECLKQKKWGLALARLNAGIVFRYEKNAARREQLAWRFLGYGLPNAPKTYDAAIGYLEKNPVYYCIDKVSAGKKIGFIHNDYEQLGMDRHLDVKPFKKLDYLMTVSNECGAVLEKVFPEYRHKVRVMHNIISPAAIAKLAFTSVPPLPQQSQITIVSVGRLAPQKGFDMAIEACRILVDKGMDVVWYVIGEGTERPHLEQMISEKNLENRFVLLGLRDNPYTYVAMADIYVQPSRFEGKSIAVDEAKILHKPIVVSNFTTAADQITHERNGLIAEIHAEAISSQIERFIHDAALRRRCIEVLQGETHGTEHEIHKFYELLA
ncbi:glycosyltransferase [Paenibacillus soyae]|uniref:Glycosyltransferase n=1 Tax=Paenibacillus soyae TaxID=2969249 RepID=A0A9X2MIP0_9BACL|nr:glycosyltransferase [Paenibacillus soyae]MCR2802513.1 glycosyltransferase [Paenibacillus soyae]